jgi:hypothetical protein
MVKKYKLPHIDQIPTELVQAGGKTLQNVIQYSSLEVNEITGDHHCGF